MLFYHLWITEYNIFYFFRTPLLTYHWNFQYICNFKRFPILLPFSIFHTNIGSYNISKHEMEIFVLRNAFRDLFVYSLFSLLLIICTLFGKKGDFTNNKPCLLLLWPSLFLRLQCHCLFRFVRRFCKGLFIVVCAGGWRHTFVFTRKQ